MIVLVYTCEPFILSWIFPGKIEQQILIGKIVNPKNRALKMKKIYLVETLTEIGAVVLKMSAG